MRKRRARPAEPENAGEDSFMDVVANLVGILIILIMVVGVHAQGAAVEKASDASPPADDSALAEREQALRHLANLETNIREIKQQADSLGALAQVKQQERHQLNVLLTAARMELDERKQELSAEQQTQVEISSEEDKLQRKLKQIEAQADLLSQEKVAPIELEHVPTPLAKTVFGDEEHFRLQAGRLVYVPLNELTDLLREDAPRRVTRLLEVPQITETLGPIQGFHLRYTMERQNVGTVTPAGPVVRQMAQMTQFTLVPTADNLGEPFEEALADQSQFRQMLDAFKPGRTVVTVWTYPDSFAQFRHLKQWLYERGFACAARPLPDGQLITGSPQGSRSAAQ